MVSTRSETHTTPVKMVGEEKVHQQGSSNGSDERILMTPQNHGQPVARAQNHALGGSSYGPLMIGGVSGATNGVLGVVDVQGMNSNSNGQPATRSVGTSTNNPNQTTSGSNILLTVSITLAAANFGAVIALLALRLSTSLLQFDLNSKSPNLILFGILVACIAIGFACNLITIFSQKALPIIADIAAYAGVLLFAIAFLTMIGMILPHTLSFIVWLACGFIFLLFLCLLIKFSCCPWKVEGLNSSRKKA